MGDEPNPIAFDSLSDEPHIVHAAPSTAQTAFPFYLAESDDDIEAEIDFHLPETFRKSFFLLKYLDQAVEQLFMRWDARRSPMVSGLVIATGIAASMNFSNEEYRSGLNLLIIGSVVFISIFTVIFLRVTRSHTEVPKPSPSWLFAREVVLSVFVCDLGIAAATITYIIKDPCLKPSITITDSTNEEIWESCVPIIYYGPAIAAMVCLLCRKPRFFIFVSLLSVMPFFIVVSRFINPVDSVQQAIIAMIFYIVTLLFCGLLKWLQERDLRRQFETQTYLEFVIKEIEERKKDLRDYIERMMPLVLRKKLLQRKVVLDKADCATCVLVAVKKYNDLSKTKTQGSIAKSVAVAHHFLTEFAKLPQYQLQRMGAKEDMICFTAGLVSRQANNAQTASQFAMDVHEHYALNSLVLEYDPLELCVAVATGKLFGVVSNVYVRYDVFGEAYQTCLELLQNLLISDEKRSISSATQQHAPSLFPSHSVINSISHIEDVETSHDGRLSNLDTFHQALAQVGATTGDSQEEDSGSDDAKTDDEQAPLAEIIDSEDTYKEERTANALCSLFMAAITFLSLITTTIEVNETPALRAMGYVILGLGTLMFVANFVMSPIFFETGGPLVALRICFAVAPVFLFFGTACVRPSTASTDTSYLIIILCAVSPFTLLPWIPWIRCTVLSIQGILFIVSASVNAPAVKVLELLIAVPFAIGAMYFMATAVKWDLTNVQESRKVKKKKASSELDEELRKGVLHTTLPPPIAQLAIGKQKFHRINTGVAAFHHESMCAVAIRFDFLQKPITSLENLVSSLRPMRFLEKAVKELPEDTYLCVTQIFGDFVHLTCGLDEPHRTVSEDSFTEEISLRGLSSLFQILPTVVGQCREQGSTLSGVVTYDDAVTVLVNTTGYCPFFSLFGFATRQAHALLAAAPLSSLSLTSKAWSFVDNCRAAAKPFFIKHAVEINRRCSFGKKTRWCVKGQGVVEMVPAYLK